MKLGYKTQIGTMAMITSMALATPTLAQTYQCVKPVSEETIKKNRKPRGNWGPQHNTKNWTYVAVNGKDIYRHKNGKRTVGTRCQKGAPGRYNFGIHKVDLEGLQDYCVTIIPATSMQTATPSCPSGYSISMDRKTCTRGAKPGYWKKNRKPRGNWGPQHNTKNWTYAAVNGKDIYRHKNGRRTVGTRCQKGAPGRYNFGTHKVDFDGLQDYCATWIAPISASTIPSNCASGYSLQPISSGGGNSSTSHTHTYTHSHINTGSHTHSNPRSIPRSIKPIKKIDSSKKRKN